MMTTDSLPSEHTRELDPICNLLRTMAPRRTVLLAVLRFCESPQNLKAISIEVDRIQANNKSVFGAASLCMALEEVCGLKRVTEDGAPYETVDLEPLVVKSENEGESDYYKVPETPEVFWLTTNLGHAVIAADDPMATARAILQAEHAYAPIYQKVLNACNIAEGSTATQIGKQVDNDPLVQNPRLFAGHFIERLENIGCLTWENGVWHTTDLGRKIAAEFQATKYPTE